MARDYDYGMDYYQIGTIITAYPMTIAAWINPDVVNITQHAFGHSNDNQTGPMFVLGINSSGYPMVFCQNVSAVNSTATASSTVSADTWIHVAGVLNGNSSRYCYLDGTAGTEDTTTVTLDMTDMDALSIGASWYSNGPQSDFDGSVALAAIWDVALSAGDISDLADGELPSNVNSTDLISNIEMINYEAPYDSISEVTFSQNGTIINVANDYPSPPSGFEIDVAEQYSSSVLII